MTTPTKKGKAYLIGAGPGDPGLITVRGKEILQKTEVLIYDYLAGDKLLEFVPAGAELIYAGKMGGIRHTHTQDEINRMLVDRVRAGKIVVRLKGGDPFIFGRGGEELEELVKAGLDYEAVPGVTSASAAATFAGIPITHRDCTSSVAFITGHERPDKDETSIAWDKISTGVGTLVFYMGIKNLPSITANLIKHGRDPKTPVAVVRWASMPFQRSVIGTLETISDIVEKEGIKPPALTIVGDVVNYRKKLDWYEGRPLFGKRIVVTRTREQASELVSLLGENGAYCLEHATISIHPPDSWQEADDAIDALADFDWLLFTSINAIHHFFKRLQAKGKDCRALHGVSIAAIGRVTADILLEYGISADLIPASFTGDGLAEAMVQQGVAGKRILIPRALEARKVLEQTLTENGGTVVIAPVYQNIPPVYEGTVLREEIKNGEVDMVTFTSSSTVVNFVSMLNVADNQELQELLKNVKIAAIGPVTAKTILGFGLHVDVQPETYTIAAMVDSVVNHFRK